MFYLLLTNFGNLSESPLSATQRSWPTFDHLMGVHTNFIHTTVKVFVDYYTRFLLFKSFAQRATQEDNSIQVKTVQGDVA